LVAEDDEMNQVFIMTALRKMGLKPDLVTDGDALVHAAVAGTYHMVFTDLRMSKLDGVSAPRRVAEERSGQKMPVFIVMTASAQLVERASSLDAGMDDVLVKPFRLIDLRSMVQAWAETARERVEGSGYVRPPVHELRIVH
jgi:CheY-like chemotaxis protein